MSSVAQHGSTRKTTTAPDVPLPNGPGQAIIHITEDPTISAATKVVLVRIAWWCGVRGEFDKARTRSEIARAVSLKESIVSKALAAYESRGLLRRYQTGKSVRVRWCWHHEFEPADLHHRTSLDNNQTCTVVQPDLYDRTSLGDARPLVSEKASKKLASAMPKKPAASESAVQLSEQQEQRAAEAGRHGGVVESGSPPPAPRAAEIAAVRDGLAELLRSDPQMLTERSEPRPGTARNVLAAARSRYPAASPAAVVDWLRYRVQHDGLRMLSWGGVVHITREEYGPTAAPDAAPTVPTQPTHQQTVTIATAPTGADALAEQEALERWIAEQLAVMPPDELARREQAAREWLMRDGRWNRMTRDAQRDEVRLMIERELERQYPASVAAA